MFVLVYSAASSESRELLASFAFVSPRTRDHSGHHSSYVFHVSIRPFSIRFRRMRLVDLRCSFFGIVRVNGRIFLEISEGATAMIVVFQAINIDRDLMARRFPSSSMFW